MDDGEEGACLRIPPGRIMGKDLITSASKISAPKTSGMVKRERLFRLLDRGREKRLIWIAAPAGSGKTTLVSGWLNSRKLVFLWQQIDAGDGDPATFFLYLGLAARKATPKEKRALPLLTPEYLMGIPGFTRRFFEDVCGRLPSSAVIVLDNYQEAPADSMLHEILLYGIEAAPAGITFVVLSRSDPPPQLARARIADQLHPVGWPDLRFTVEEAKGLALSHGAGVLDDEALARLHGKADGWAAGLALLVRTEEQWRIRGPSAETPAILFDYFAQEIFLRTSPAIRDFLLKTSFFPSLTVHMAQRITGNDDARAILGRLRREHYFIESYSDDEVIYQYHPLFREFLRNSAATGYSREEADGIRLRAAELLIESGRMDEAGEILCEARDSERLVTLILAHAESMISQGRLVPLQRWLSLVHNERLRQEPWLCYWSGVCSHPFDLGASEGFFSDAFHLFRKRGALGEALMAWAGTVACIITEWRDFSKLDPWIDWLSIEADRALEAMQPELRARVVGLMLICLTFRQPLHPKIAFYEGKAAALLDEPMELSALLTISCHLLTHYTKMGLLRKARGVLDLVELKVMRKKDLVSPEYILWHTVKASYFALSGAKQESLRENGIGLELAAGSGMNIYDIFMLFFGAMAGFIDGDPSVIDTYLERISAARGGPGLILPIITRQVIAWKCLLEEDYASAREHVDAAMQQTLRLGSSIEHSINRICYSQILFELGMHEEAGKFLAEGSAGAPENSVYLAYMRLTTEAYFSYRAGDEASGERLLREAMALGSRHRIMMHHYWTDRITRCLCTKALEQGIETAYACELARCHGIPLDPKGPARVEAPVMIHTLGRFQILLDGQPLEFARKAQKRPLELVKALIALGGLDVSRDSLCDALWPDTARDQAYNSFKFTLHQARRLLKKDTALTLRNGRLSFNSHDCWIDALAFTQLSGQVVDLCRKAERHMPESSAVGIEDLARQATELYGGAFLPSDADLPWAASARDRIRERMLRMLLAAGRYMESLSLWEKALFFHEKSVDIDDTNEEAYRCVMRCCAALGRIDAGIAAYRTCRGAISRVRTIRPSPETDALYHSLLKG